MANFDYIPIYTEAKKIEEMANMEINKGAIDKNSNNLSYPTSKAVFEHTSTKLDINDKIDIIFQGGDAESEVHVDLSVDEVLSTTSENLVKNKVIAEEFLKYTPTDEINKAFERYPTTMEVEKIINQNFYPIGSIWIGGKYEESVIDLDTEELIHAAGEPINPADIFGGKWELIDKTFAPYRKWITDSGEMGNLISSGDDLSVSSIGIARFENEIKLSINGKFNVDISPDSNNSILFQIPESSLNNWGIQYIANSGSIIHPVYHFAYSDDANSIIAFQASDAGGGNIRFTAVEQAPQNNNGIIKSGSSFHMTVSLSFMHYYLLDSCCNKFYWRRIELT